MTYRDWRAKPLDRSALPALTEALAQRQAALLEQAEAQGGCTGPDWAGPGQWTAAKRAGVLAAQKKELGLLAGVLAARGVAAPQEAAAMLGSGQPLGDPFAIKDMDKAAARLLQAVDAGEPLVIFGDYDVDGITATALLFEYLRGLGAQVRCKLPSREGDGYGLSRHTIDALYQKGYRLIVTVDNGISAVEEAAYAASLGMQLVITDHHLPPAQLPEAVAVVDPRRPDDTSPFKGLCGAGVAFMLCAALEGCAPEELLELCGDLAAIGTVADVMPLTGANRTLVKAGLQVISRTCRPGLAALLELAGLAGKQVTAENISYALAPRLNAAGRMGRADVALQLLLCEEEDAAASLAHTLAEANAARQQCEQQLLAEAEQQLDADPTLLQDRVLLVWGRGWHQGVAGIVAARLMEKLGRPAIVVSVDEAGEGKGSGRSVQGFNLHACISSCADLLLRFGGHAMAAGLSVRQEQLPALRRRLNEWAARECPAPGVPPLDYDLALRLPKVTVQSVRQLEQLAPFGAGNPTPVFLLQQAVLEAVYPISEGRHCRLRLRQGSASIYAVWFGMPPQQLAYGVGDTVDVLLNLSVYDAARGASLSGRVIELRAAGLTGEAARQAALVEALRRGVPLTGAQKLLLRPARSEIAAVYRALQAQRWHAGDLQPLFAKLGEQNTGKVLVALTALEQVELAAVQQSPDGVRYWQLLPASGKKDLAGAPILRCLA